MINLQRANLNMALVLRHHGSAKEKHIQMFILRIQRPFEVPYSIIIMPKLIFQVPVGLMRCMIYFSLICHVTLFSNVCLPAARNLLGCLW